MFRFAVSHNNLQSERCIILHTCCEAITLRNLEQLQDHLGNFALAAYDSTNRIEGLNRTPFLLFESYSLDKIVNWQLRKIFMIDSTQKHSVSFLHWKFSARWLEQSPSNCSCYYQWLLLHLRNAPLNVVTFTKLLFSESFNIALALVLNC